MRLVNIEIEPTAAHVLYDLLSERAPEHSISHKEMPPFLDHVSFVRDHPYAAWYLIEVEDNDDFVGTVCLTKPQLGGFSYVGVQVFAKFRRKGYAEKAVNLLKAAHGQLKYAANINPANEPSRKLWEKMGFKHVQDTYAL